MIEHEALAGKKLEEQPNKKNEVRRIAGMDHVEAMPSPDLQREHELPEQRDRVFDEIGRGAPRLEEQDVDGIDAEVMFGSARMMSHFFSDPDPEFQLAGVRAYNDWLAQEIMTVDPSRLIGLAAMPALSVDASIAEMERCLKLGFRGVWINTMPSVGPAIRPEDDRFWAAAEANGVAIHFHVRIMRALAKQRLESIEGFVAGGRTEAADAERYELRIIESFLPRLADEDTTRAWVRDAIAASGATSAADIGKVMGKLMGAHKAELDGKLANKIVRELLA